MWIAIGVTALFFVWWVLSSIVVGGTRKPLPELRTCELCGNAEYLRGRGDVIDEYAMHDGSTARLCYGCRGAHVQCDACEKVCPSTICRLDNSGWDEIWLCEDCDHEPASEWDGSTEKRERDCAEGKK